VRPWLQARDLKSVAIVTCGALGVALAMALIALPGLWYIAWADAESPIHHELAVGLLELSSLDASWERAALQPTNDVAPALAADYAARLAAVAKRLETAAQGASSVPLHRGLPEVTRAFAEKAELMGHFHKARAISQGALRNVLAMESEIAGIMRGAWRDAPDRQRLVAADNVVTQILAEAQRYYFTAAAPDRTNLEASTADLRSAAAVLPESLGAAAGRLEQHVADLLRAKPSEQAYLDRVRFHNAGARAATLMRELEREVEENSAARERYRAYLAVYFCALLVLVAYIAARLIRRALARRARGSAAAPTAARETVPAEPSPASSSDGPPG
jgi:hypothetical protein